jgi:dihydrofolate reductase
MQAAVDYLEERYECFRHHAVPASRRRDVFIVGGSGLYKEVLLHDKLGLGFLTRVHSRKDSGGSEVPFPVDVFFPKSHLEEAVKKHGAPESCNITKQVYDWVQSLKASQKYTLRDKEQTHIEENGVTYDFQVFNFVQKQVRSIKVD